MSYSFVRLPGRSTGRTAEADSLFRSYPFAVCIHLLVFAAIAWTAFALQPSGLFVGLEGMQHRMLIEEQSIWQPFGQDLGIDPIFGPGVTTFAINNPLVPVYHLAIWLTGIPFDARVLYLLLAVEMFAAVYFLGRAIGVDRAAAVLGSWITCLYCLPFWGPSVQIYTVGHAVPYFADLMAAAAAAIALFHQVGRGWRQDLGRIALLLILEAVAVAAYPALVVVIAPPTVAYAIVSIVISRSGRERLAKIVAALALVLVPLATGQVTYLAAVYIYSATGFFYHELRNAQDNLVFASILFHAKSYSLYGPALAVGGLLGAFKLALRRRSEATDFARGHLVITIGLLVTGYFLHRPGATFTGPKVLFVEYALLPFYGLYAGVLLADLAAWAVKRTVAGRAAVPTAHWVKDCAAVLPVVAIVCAAIFARPPDKPDPYEVNPDTPITVYLRQAIAAVPGEPFRGRVATFSGYAGKPPGLTWYWTDLDIMDLVHYTQNDHRLAGLWRSAIPTLQDNSELTSPPVYLVQSRLLSRPGDVQTRNFVWFTNPDIPTLRLFGVRYVIWDQPDLPETHTVATMHWGEGNSRELKVIEIEDANTKGYSPTEIEAEKSASDMIDRMKKNFDPRAQVIVASDDVAALGGLRGRILLSEIVPERGFVRVRAKSDGPAMLVIPYEFSHCMVPEAEPGTATPRLLRANLVNTAVLFAGDLDVKIDLRFGPFWHNICRLKDIADMNRLDIRHVAPLGAAR